MIHIDIETRSRTALKEVGVDVYAYDPSTEVLCLAVAAGDADPELWVPGQPVPDMGGRGELVAAWNVSFERAIWEAILVPRFGFPPIKWERWRCTMAQAAAMGLPQAIGPCAKQLGTALKDESGRRVMLKLAKPAKDGSWNEDLEDLQTLYEYCKDDVRAERGIAEALEPLTPRELEIWDLDQRINYRGIPIDVELVQHAEGLADLALTDLNNKMMELTGGEVESVNQVAKLKAWLHENYKLQVDSLSADIVDKLMKIPFRDPKAKQVIGLRQRGAKSSTRKLTAIGSRVRGGRVRYSLRYYGAFTGRWSGAGIQPQNLPRGDNKLRQQNYDHLISLVKSGQSKLARVLYGDPLEICKTITRGAIRANRLLVWDFGQIEARVLAWVAGEDEALQPFVDGSDPYKAMASRIWGIPESEVSPDQRFVGKTAVLGLGYQMGANAFYSTLLNFGRNDATLDLAANVVKVFRSSFRKIVAFWYAAEQAAKMAVAVPGSSQIVRSGSGVSFRFLGGCLRCRLPSGREIFYPSARIDAGGSLEYRKPRVGMAQTYGGKLTENIVQAIARDVMADGMMGLDAAGYQIVCTIHDEVLAEATLPEHTVSAGAKILCDVGPWAEGLPVIADGFETTNYRKG
jgi:DNA polymerase